MHDTGGIYSICASDLAWDEGAGMYGLTLCEEVWMLAASSL